MKTIGPIRIGARPSSPSQAQAAISRALGAEASEAEVVAPIVFAIAAEPGALDGSCCTAMGTYSSVENGGQAVRSAGDDRLEL